MSTELELTLTELTRSALGVPKLSNDNIAILYSLFDIILKKLNCSDEKVTIGGFESHCFEQLLKISKVSSLVFDDDNVERISEKLNRLTQIEQNLSNVESKLEKHYDQIRKSHNMSDDTFHWKNWERYTIPCEDLCYPNDKEVSTNCSLLKNPDFMKKLQRIISKPIVQRLLKLESKIDNMHTELSTLLKRLEKYFEKTALVKHAIYDIEGTRKLIAQNNSQFISTMDEVQDQLDAKLDKNHIPAIKKYIKDRLDTIEGELIKLKNTKKTCPKDIRAMRIGDKCLSCGRSGGGSGFEVCSHPVHTQTKQPVSCVCENLYHSISANPKLSERMKHLKQGDVARNIRNSFDERKSIKFAGATVGSIDSFYF